MKALPDYLKKRKLFYSERSSPEELKKFGDRFLQEEQWNDAVDFYEKADCREGLEAVGKLSKEAGDFFIFQRIGKILKREVSMEEWEALGDSSQELGRLQDAMKAYQMAQNDIKIEGMKKKIESKGEKEIEEEHS